MTTLAPIKAIAIMLRKVTLCQLPRGTRAASRWARCPAPERSQHGRGAGFIDEDEAGGFARRSPLAPRSPLLGALLYGPLGRPTRLDPRGEIAGVGLQVSPPT